MLLSMTGYGDARLQDERWTVDVEIRSVNNRHLKFTARVSDPYGSIEPELERLIRESVRRGTVQVSVRVERPKRAEDYRLNLVAIASYSKQLQELQGDPSRPVDLAALLSLPGVVEDRRTVVEAPHDDWAAFEGPVREALAKFQKSRAEEGKAMAAELLALGRTIADHLAAVEVRGPEIVAAYRDRILERVEALVKDRGATIEPKDLIREVAIFAERADVAEEIVRLKAHLAQYEELLAAPESAGRKLEFVVQEMGREINTTGSKANDVAISRAVVEMKGALEKIRELIQNVE